MTKATGATPPTKEQVHIRPEADGDIAAVRSVNRAAFESDEEADIVDALRAQANPVLSLVAVEGQDIVGHVMFSPVSLEDTEAARLMALGPMAVLPNRQGFGIGSRLVEEGLQACRGLECAGVVLVGHPTYYPRFGFMRASRFSLRCGFDVPDDVFMVRELQPGALEGLSGTVRFHNAFTGG